MKNTNCCQCGRARLFHEAQMPDYRANPGILSTEGLVARTPQLGPTGNEIPPTMLASACVYRNGGSSQDSTHICRWCLAVGIRALLEIMQRDLAELTAGEEVPRG